MDILRFLIPSLALTVLCTMVPWGARQVKSWQIALVVGAALILSVLGIVFSLAWYPWTDLLILLGALSGGVVLSRVMSTKLWPFLLLLLVLSIADVVQQAVLTAGSTSPGNQSAGTSIPTGELYGNFLVSLPWGHYNIGIFDLLLLTALAEYWRRRGSAFLVGLASGVIGFLLALVFTLFIYGGALPLIPFLLAGWLCSVGLNAYRQRHNGSQVALNRTRGGAELQEHGHEGA